MSPRLRSLTLVSALVLLSIVVLAPPVIWAVSYPFVDDGESLGGWVADSPWDRTTADYHSANNSWTDSPSSYYANGQDASLTLASAVDLSGATSTRLSFWHHYSLEAGFDFGYVEVATSSSAGPWSSIATYSGTVTAPYTTAATAAKASGGPATSAFPSTPGEPWVLEQLSLDGYVGQSTVWVRFRVVTDGTVVDDGWYVDDVAIAELPAAVTLSDPTGGAAISATAGSATVTVLFDDEPVTPIPAASPWGLAAFAVLTAAALVAMRRRQSTGKHVA